MKTTSRTPDSLKNWFLLLLAVSIMTIFVHSYLSQHGYNLKLGLEAGQSICNVSATFNCDKAAVSSYASFLGIPLALLGVFTQIVLLVFLLSCHWDLSSHSDLLRRLIFWLTAFVALVSLVMAAISVFALGSYCPFCMVTYALSFVAVFAAYKYQIESPWPQLSSDLSQLFSSVRWPIFVLLGIPAMGYVSNGIILDSYGYEKSNRLNQDAIALWEQNPVIEFNTEQGLSFGNTNNPKMTIVEFADFLCPHCRLAYPALHAFVLSHPDTRLIFKNFPLDSKCNKSLTHSGDGHRCRLASAVVCSAKLFNKGWEFHHWFFDHQESMGPLERFSETLDKVSSENQVSGEAIKKCLDEDSTLEAVQATGLEGFNAKIGGTPSVFVNGKALDRGQYLPVLEAVYKKLNP